MAPCIHKRGFTQILRNTTKDEKKIRVFFKSLIWKLYINQDSLKSILKSRKEDSDSWQVTLGYKPSKIYFKGKLENGI